MNTMELTSIDWLGRGWLLVLAFTAAVLVVTALRKPCRRLFGARRAFQLWLLPPLAMLASQLPHAAATPIAVLSPVVLTITSAAAAISSHAMDSSAIDWRIYTVLIWLAGIVITLLFAVLAQLRYRTLLRGATPIVDVSSRWPVLRAVGEDVGPALVGAWRVRIVLPPDFEQRYDATERALILAHETMHARRRDGCWCLLAQIVTAMCWFHPLAWWALSALRHDQELACDAAVLHEHGDQRRSYAHAMLKTQSTVFALPVGCLWSPRHPITERIAMLKLPDPSRSRSVFGMLIVSILIVAVSGMAYAASQPPAKQAQRGHAETEGRYTLKLALSVDGQPARLHATSCLKPGEYYSDTQMAIGKLPPWHDRHTIVPVEGGLLEVQTELSGGSLPKPVYPKLRTMPGQMATIQVGQKVEGKDGKVLEDHTIKIDVTPSAGC